MNVIPNVTDRERLQSNLVTLRTVAGWNADYFAKMIGVSRQYYSEIENKSKTLTHSLYLACLYVFENEAKNNNELLTVLNELLENDKVSNENCHELSEYISSERKKKTIESVVEKNIETIVGAALMASSIIGIIVKSIVKKK